MLKNLFRSFVIARTASAADEVIRNMSDRQLQDVGIDRGTHVRELMFRMQDEYAAQDAEAKVLKLPNIPLNIKLQSA